MPAPRPLPGWESFEQALASALSVLKDEFRVASTRTGNRFVQFNARPDDGADAEAVCNAYLGPSEKLDAGQMADLLFMGWAAPPLAQLADGVLRALRPREEPARVAN